MRTFSRFILWIIALPSSLGLLQKEHQASASLLDEKALRDAIWNGRVYQQEGFLSESQVKEVLNEIAVQESLGSFQKKGLSNTATVNKFDNKLDRAICPVPWFAQAMEETDKREIPSIIRKLQLSLSQTLNRPTIADTTIAHECYYSKSEVGSRLPRHMDERHEELKGAKGWLGTSRRSLSWLIYLSDPREWDLKENGGALRTFPQTNTIESDATHKGNLQVGWLVHSSQSSKPVYLDSFYPAAIRIDTQGSMSSETEPHCVLYSVDDQGTKELLTRPWLMEQLHGITVPEFLKAYAQQDSKDESPILFVNSKMARQFTLLEDRQAWEEGNIPKGSEIVDISPLRGSLVVFDSVKLPHQVQLIHSGTRLALAGWFHETIPLELLGMF